MLKPGQEVMKTLTIQSRSKLFSNRQQAFGFKFIFYPYAFNFSKFFESLPEKF